MSAATDRVRVEERLVMLAAGAGTWRYDLARDRFLADELAHELLGLDGDAPLTRDALIGRVHHESARALERFLSGEAALTETDSVVIRLAAPDGADRYVVARARVLLGRGGEGRELVGIVTDDTERQQLQQELRERESWLATLVSGVPQSFMYLDRHQRVVFANDVFLSNTGWVGRDVRGKHLSEIHGAELYAARTRHIERALGGETVSYEAVGRRGDGMGFFHHEFKPDLDAQGNVVGLFATATDITDRHEMGLELEAKQAELVRSNRDLEQFAYVASHDLKAPLRAIELLVAWLREDLADYRGGDVQENLGLLGQRTQRLGRLLDDLLEYSRVGRKIGSVHCVDSHAMVRELVELMALPEGMSVEIDDALPTFTTYSTPLEQVLRNLIGNAIKHHPGPGGTITVGCETSDEFHLFSVADDGAGIPEQYAERVFQMFQTLKPRDEVEGSGMGLAIVNRIIEWQGGRVWFEPGPGGRGTVFKFQWKRTAPAHEATQVIEEAACRPATR